MLINFIDKQDSSVIVIHARQHEAGQENAVFTAIERYEKRLWLCARAVGHVKTDDVDRCTRGTVEWSIPLEKSLSTN